MANPWVGLFSRRDAPADGWGCPHKDPELAVRKARQHQRADSGVLLRALDRRSRHLGLRPVGWGGDLGPRGARHVGERRGWCGWGHKATTRGSRSRRSVIRDLRLCRRYSAPNVRSAPAVGRWRRQLRPRQIDVPEEAPFVKSLRRSRSRYFGWLEAVSVGFRARVIGTSGLEEAQVWWRGGQGRAVRPARRGSLEGPGGEIVASHDLSWNAAGVPGRLGVGHSSDLTIGAQNWAGQAVWFGCRTFLRPDGWCMVCSGHSQTGSFSSPAAPFAGGHVDLRARVLAVSEPAQPASWARQRISPSRRP